MKKQIRTYAKQITAIIQANTEREKAEKEKAIQEELQRVLDTIQDNAICEVYDFRVQSQYATEIYEQLYSYFCILQESRRTLHVILR